MSGRGRGRGRGRAAAPPSVANAASSLAVATIVPSTTVPPPRFPVPFRVLRAIIITHSPIPNNNPQPTPLPEAHDPPELDDAVRFAEELRYFMQKHSPAHLGARRTKGTLAAPVVDRYSDKYALDARTAVASTSSKIASIVTDLAFFPEELHSVYQGGSGQAGRRAATGAAPPAVEPRASFLDTLARIKALEGKDEDASRDAPSSQADRERGEGEGDGEGEDDEVVYEEEELEDETDYNLTYFDNGEDYGDHDDGDGIIFRCRVISPTSLLNATIIEGPVY